MCIRDRRDVPDDFVLSEKHQKQLRQYDLDKKSGKRAESQKPHYADALVTKRKPERTELEQGEDNYLWVQCDTCSAWIVGNKWGFRKESDVPDYFMCDVCEEIEYGTDYEDCQKSGGGIKAGDPSWHPNKLLAKPVPAQHSAADLEEYRRILEEEEESQSEDDGSDMDDSSEE
eukprot:TRINITY_DN13479_c0_g1_i2.p1 TRINITY_DN13479_c0_g1~~TRINITY_DN13479_c0_g1_i2.p1  ORF type:complete len:173 (-),score=49.47 TRINITY_DN13479_c0_g1_i2:108-626(-)